ncbi:YIP1 family protein [Flavobacterium sp. W21_SRS_FM6]|uniref:YIP1 family protein n=1 Tax=Flavobacterium sp. W21_SRS_FM6 TaxID=3240268 RepID=UPI003F921A64
MESVNNPFQACFNILLKPNGVFAKVRMTHNWSWIPFLLIMSVAVLPELYYFSTVDIDWYRELMVQTTAANISPSEQNVIRQSLNKEVLLWSGTFGAALSLIIANVILALYLNFCAKADEECVEGFTDWYGFCWWVSLPTIFVSILGLLAIALSESNQILPTAVHPTSIAYFLSIEMSSAWYGLCQSIRIEHFWYMYLTTVGLAQWTQLSKQRITVIAIAPYAIIWGIWLLTMIF